MMRQLDSAPLVRGSTAGGVSGVRGIAEISREAAGQGDTSWFTQVGSATPGSSLKTGALFIQPREVLEIGEFQWTQDERDMDPQEALARLMREGWIRLFTQEAEWQHEVFADDVEAVLWQRARRVIGKYHAGVRDLGRRHDEYLAEDL